MLAGAASEAGPASPLARNAVAHGTHTPYAHSGRHSFLSSLAGDEEDAYDLPRCSALHGAFLCFVLLAFSVTGAAMGYSQRLRWRDAVSYGLCVFAVISACFVLMGCSLLFICACYFCSSRCRRSGRGAGDWATRAIPRPSSEARRRLFSELRAEAARAVAAREAREALMEKLPLSTAGSVSHMSTTATDPESVEQRRCPVCIEEFAEGDEQRRLPCFHTFHRGCVDQWLEEREACPLCRHDILLNSFTENKER